MASAISRQLLGVLADSYGVETVYQICSFLPLAGLLAWFLPGSTRALEKEPEDDRQQLHAI